MGYYTYHTLSISNEQPGDVEKIFDFAKEKEMDFTYGFDVCDGSLEARDQMKWYEHETEMREISEKFPHILFELHGEGEENGDIWDEYYQAGKMQRCEAEITTPSFDPTKLQ